jgi:uncharacterized protein (TIGR02145 family)
MKKHNVLTLITVFIVYSLSAQDIHVTFSATGAAASIDSIRVTNLSNGQSLVMPGDRTLTLRQGYTGIERSTLEETQVQVYPNPCNGTTRLSIWNPSDQEVTLKVTDVQGTCLHRINKQLNPGEHDFRLQLSHPGLFIVQVLGQGIRLCVKVLSLESTGNADICFLGLTSEIRESQPLKSLSQTEYLLGYERGELVHYRCMSDIYTSIVTDIPEQDMNNEVEFVHCQDLDGKNYSTVKIGEQKWMAENLAYLPAIDSVTISDAFVPRFYVYGYYGYDIDQAKSTDNYNAYGVMYNWEAARASCPSGWHLPDDSTWNIMISHFEEPVGGKLKEIGLTHWNNPNTGATIFSGFTALPGGGKGWNLDFFWAEGYLCSFWSSTHRGSGYFGPNASCIVLAADSDIVDHAGSVASSVVHGYSVRCVKDE